MKGRKAQPAGLKLLKGERPDRMPAPGPSGPTAVPEPPTYLDSLAREKWAELAPGLAADGLLAGLGTETLALYCEAYGRWRSACEELQAHGAVLETALGGTKANPAAGVVKAAADQMARIVAEWERKRAARVATETPKDDLAEFLAQMKA